MECVEAALKTSFRKDMAIRLSPQVFFDDLCTLSMQNVTSSDDFIVDELLDFSNEEQQLIVVDDDNQQKSCATVSTSLSASPTQQEQQHEDDKIGQNLSNFASELCVPVDDLASLEWLSRFVDDSNSVYSAPFPAGISQQKPSTAEEVKKNGNGENDMSFYVQQKVVSRHAIFKTPVPAKARSKRSRTGLSVWPLGSPSLTAESSSSSSSCSSCSFSSSSPSSPRRLVFTTHGLTSEPFEPASFEKPLVKKPKRRFSGESGTGGGGSQPARRCSHCGVQKTPQWRAGPLGAKTLCNACGVRFKSGRLFPEYRPACSPTFSIELHSNHHRKVLEMRKKKEVLDQAEPGFIHPMVPGF